MAIINGDATDETLTGTAQSDFVNGGAGDDAIFGLGGDDFLDGDLGDDSVDGGEGADVINGGPGDDVLFGGEGDDQLFGEAGSDTLTGGPGDDALFGGADADTFAFSFTVETGDGGGGTADAPDLQGARQNVFVNEYRAFLLDLGIDVDDPDSGWTWDQNDAEGPLRYLGEPVGEAVAVTVSTGRTTKTRWIADAVPVDGEEGEPVLTASEGADVIGDFDALDVIEFRGLGGLDADALEALFDLKLVDVNGDASDDTVLSWDGGSLTVLGWAEAEDVRAFFADDQVALL